MNIRRALSEGITAATLIHPWNAEIVEPGGVVAGRDWRELAAAIEPLLT